MAEKKGFEPLVEQSPTVDFESTALDHSATSPEKLKSIKTITILSYFIILC